MTEAAKSQARLSAVASPLGGWAKKDGSSNQASSQLLREPFISRRGSPSSPASETGSVSGVETEMATVSIDLTRQNESVSWLSMTLASRSCRLAHSPTRSKAL